MSSFTTYVLIPVFAAFLPPTSAEDRDFYDVLGVPRTASDEDIRKAYKKKSLSLHPDKVAQFGRGDPEVAAREYEQVQHAYTVLSNPKKRQTYHAVQCSPTRYHFVESGAFQNPTALIDNLAHASLWTKLRLVAIVGLIFCLMLLQPILIAAKLNQSLKNEGGLLETTKWTVILIPLWIFHGLLVLLFMLTTVAAPSEARWSLVLTTLNQASWLVAELLLALRWDQTLTNLYSIIFIPVYIGMFLRCVQAVDSMRQVGKDIQRMVSSNYMIEKVLNGRDLDDLTEEERLDIYKKYIVVHVPPDVEVDGESEAALEQGRVESSPEFERAQEVMGQSIAAFWNTVVFGVTFVALVVSKLDSKIDVDWWGVFTPIWIYFGSQFVYSGYTCCCGTISGQEIILQVPSSSNNDINNSQNAENDAEGETENFGANQLFVAAEGSTRDFNKTNSNPDDADRGASAVQLDAVATTAAGNDEDNTKSTEKAAATSNDSNDAELKKSNPPLDGKQPSNNHPAAPDGNVPHIHIDEETFRAWQSAYAEAELSAQQEQSRATLNCVVVGFQTLMLCLVVGKLENDYHNHPPQGYNAMWVLFPVFVFVGLCFCFCACAICCATVPEDSQEVDELVGSSQDAGKESKAEQGLDPKEEPVSPPQTQPTNEAADVTELTEQSNVVDPSTANNDIADLD